MSVSRSPLRNAALRRREEEADAKRVTAILGALCVIAAAAYVGGIVWFGWR